MWRLLIPLVFLLAGCKKEANRRCFKGTGQAVSESRQFGSFQSVELHDHIDYMLIQDSTDQVIIRCGENLVAHIRTELEDGLLRIKDENKCRWIRSLPSNIQVEVHYTSLRQITSHSSGHMVISPPIKGDAVDFDTVDNAGSYTLAFESNQASIQIHAGGPRIEVSGTCDMAYFYNNSTGIILAEDLLAQGAWVDNKSSGEIRLTSGGGPLWYMLDGYGSSYYRGEPSEIIEVSRLGTGDLIKID